MQDNHTKESYIANPALVERLRIAMERAHTNARELAEKAEVGRSFVYDILSGKSNNPTTQKLAAVAKELGVSMSYLLYGEERWGDKPRDDLAFSGNIRDDVVTIASIAVEASAGGGTLVTDEREDKPFFFRRSWVRDKLNVSTNDLRVIDVRGDSMLPTLSSGDVVLINLKDKSPSPPGIFVLFDGYGLVVKRLEFHNPEAVQIISDNTQYAPYTRALNDINIIGRVVWFAREL